MKNRIKNKVTHIWSDFSTKETYFNIRTKEKDAYCKNCNKDLRLLNENIGLAFVENQINSIVCQDCCKYFINLGAIDSKKEKQEANNKKADLIQQIDDYNFSNLFYHKELYELSIEDLEKIIKVKNEEENKLKLLQEDILNYVDEPTEQYLIEQYNLIEDKLDLKSSLQIEDYFKNIGRNYFKCGQGYCDYSVELYVKIGNKYYNVTINANIGSAKQEYGDRLYWVESIESIIYNETIKYPKKLVNNYIYNLTLTNIQKENLDFYLKQNKLSVTI